jgi:predicted dehydrogenase
MQFVVVGFGRAGKQHLEALKMSRHADVHSVLEVRSDLDIGPHRRAESWGQVLRDPSVDGVSLCLPPGGRAALALEALAAGKTVMLEKPAVANADELEKVLAGSGRVGVMLQHRGLLLSDLQAGWDADSVGTLLVSRPRPAGHFTGWRAEASIACGGVTAHLGVHYLDLACQLFGEPVGVTISDCQQCAPGIDVRCAGVLTFIGGATLAFVVTATTPQRLELLQLVGPRGSLTISDGTVRLSSPGQQLERPAPSNQALRAAAYDDLVLGGSRSSLARSRGVTLVLERISQWSH